MLDDFPSPRTVKAPYGRPPPSPCGRPPASPQAGKAYSRGSLASTCEPQSPAIMCTPVKKEWETRCERACQACRFPTHFARDSGGKDQDRLTIDVWPGSGGDALWAVFDGHIKTELVAHVVRSVPGLVFGSPLWPSAPGEALCGALRDCHESARRARLKGGSTAVVLASQAGNLWCCYAGDSRAVAGLRGGGVRRLSQEHTARLPGEESRILQAGGSIEAGCIDGLPMTRGLGNFDLEALGFACLPDIQCIPQSDVDFVVVASDGLWDVLDNEECCDMVRQWGGTDGSGVADHLVDVARRLGSSDDIAIVVIFFPEHLQQKTNPQQGTDGSQLHAKLDDMFAAADGDEA